jgi:CheY-like chemotaxis protein
VTAAAIDVVMVDDDQDVRDAISDRLEAAGYRVCGFSSGLDALDWLRAAERLPPLILVDMMMPVMDGWQFREEQIKDPLLAAVPVVMLTARHDAGCGPGMEQLRKPLKASDLIAVVARYCGARTG